MINGLKPYPHYKDSDEKALGQVPYEWKIVRLKNWVQINASTLPEDYDGEYEFDYLDIGSVGTGLLLKPPVRLKFEKAPSRARRVIHNGDTLVSTVRPNLKAIVTICGMEEPLVSSTGFTVLSPGLMAQSRFVGYVAQSENFTNQMVSEAIGIAYPAVSETKMANLIIAVPPLDQQTAIVKFLDWWTGRLELVIRAKKKIIALLNEQKQVIIHRAVTRGHNSKIHLKPSTVLWLGDIPTHWIELRSKYLFREVDKRSSSGMETHLSMSQKHGLIPASQIQEKRLVSETYTGAKLCEKGDLILNRLKAHLGVFALAKEPGLVSPDYTVLRPMMKMDARYFEAIYRTPACRVELRSRAKGIVEGFWRLYTDDFYNIRVPVPPADEQQQVMNQLEIKLTGFNSAITNLEHEIDLLAGYRSRLIVDVVAGVFDIREAAAQLPNEVISTTATGDETNIRGLPSDNELYDEGVET